jgi:hypothetical protein
MPLDLVLSAIDRLRLQAFSCRYHANMFTKHAFQIFLWSLYGGRGDYGLNNVRTCVESGSSPINTPHARSECGKVLNSFLRTIMAFVPYVAGFIAGLLALVVLKRWAARRTLSLPPGPKPLPLIGNLLDLPQEKEWLTYRTWNDRYGDVVCVDALGQKIVILGSAAAVDELLEKRGAIYSDRPLTPMLQL